MKKYFKPASSNNPVWNLTKTFIQTILFWGTFLAVIPWLISLLHGKFAIPLFRFDFQFTLSLLGFACASAIGLWSGITMALLGKGTPLPNDAPQELVIKGPYRFVRNPMALAGILQGIFVGLYLGSWIVILYSFSGVFVWHLFVRPIEEEELADRFGEAYAIYKKKIKCWLPKF